MLDEIFVDIRAAHPYTGECARNPLHCVLPPHILNSIAQKGTPRQRERALRNLSFDTSFSHARVGFDESKREERQAMRQQRRLAGRSMLEASVAGQPQRTIYTANNTQKIPGTPVRNEGDQPTGDPAVDEAYDYMGSTYDFYWQVFSRDSIDDSGMPLNGSVHYGKDYDNAFWDGQRMIYGDGDGEQFTRFTKSVDVIGHELTHGVTQAEAGLIYWKQAGALNESISDVFGSMVKQYASKQTVQQADWLIGQGLFTSEWMAKYPQDVAIRSMKAPGTAYNDPVLGKDPQPAVMKNYVNTFQDSGGVHINSGIPNYAFYLAASALGGYAWETVGPIWYATLLSPLLNRNAQFRSFAQLTLQMAQMLYPESNSPEVQAVGTAWAQVGIYV